MKDAVSSLFPFSVAMRDTNLHSDYIYIDKTARTVGTAGSSPEFQPDGVWHDCVVETNGFRQACEFEARVGYARRSASAVRISPDSVLSIRSFVKTTASRTPHRHLTINGQRRLLTPLHCCKSTE